MHTFIYLCNNEKKNSKILFNNPRFSYLCKELT